MRLLGIPRYRIGFAQFVKVLGFNFSLSGKSEIIEQLFTANLKKKNMVIKCVIVLSYINCFPLIKIMAAASIQNVTSAFFSLDTPPPPHFPKRDWQIVHTQISDQGRIQRGLGVGRGGGGGAGGGGFSRPSPLDSKFQKL